MLVQDDTIIYIYCLFRGLLVCRLHKHPLGDNFRFFPLLDPGSASMVDGGMRKQLSWTLAAASRRRGGNARGRI